MPNGPKIGNLEKVVTEEIIAQAWVEPDKAFTNRFKMAIGGAATTATMIRNDRSAAEAIETGAAPTGNVAMVVTPTSLVLLPAEMGLMNPKVSGIWLTVPREQIASLEVGDAAINHKVKLTLADGQELQWTIHKMRRKWVDGVIDALGLRA